MSDTNLDVPIDEWRTAARRVARKLRRPVRTSHTGGVLYAVLTDWPTDDRERSIHAETMSAIVRAVASSDD